MHQLGERYRKDTQTHWPVIEFENAIRLGISLGDHVTFLPWAMFRLYEPIRDQSVMAKLHKGTNLMQ